MNLKKEKLEIEKYDCRKDNEEYFIYLIPNCNNPRITDLYIQKKDYGIISHTIGFNIEESKEIFDMEEYIKNNIEEWINICNENLEIIESET